jgi:hypothetical protein
LLEQNQILTLPKLIIKEESASSQVLKDSSRTQNFGKAKVSFFGSLLMSSSLPSDRNKQVSLLADMGRLQ